MGGTFPGHTMQRICTPDGRYRYNYVSLGIHDSLGLDPQKLMEMEAVDHGWIHPDDRARFIEGLEHSASDLSPLDEEARVEQADGGYRWVRSIGSPRRQDDGSVIWDGVALDVTDRREALKALERTLSQARQNEVSEGRFATIAATDFLTPLADLRQAITALQQVDAKDCRYSNRDCHGCRALRRIRKGRFGHPQPGSGWRALQDAIRPGKQARVRSQSDTATGGDPAVGAPGRIQQADRGNVGHFGGHGQTARVFDPQATERSKSDRGSAEVGLV